MIPPSQPEDEANGRLFAHASQGDRAALGALLEQYLPGLTVFVRLQAGPLLRLRESCSDLVQSVCREVLANPGAFEYRGEQQFRHWLYTAALNKIRQHHRYHDAARRAPRHEAPDGDARLAGLQASQLTPGRQAMANETLQLLERAFEQLPEHYREVILQCRVVGLSHEEVARQTGRTVDAVRNLLHRALARAAALADVGNSSPTAT